MSDLLKAALVLGVAILIAAAIVMYFSPYQTCMRAFDGNPAIRCARALSGQ